MDPTKYARVYEIFDEAVEQDTSVRAAYLDEACGADAELRREVESLLTQERGEGARTDVLSDERIAGSRRKLEEMLPGTGELSTPPGPVRAGPGPPRELPETIDRYRVIRRIGTGGMGAVYEAEQDHPQRRVAVKMIDPRRSTPSLIARFRREAEILGRLKHPGIAQIHDAGTIDFGEGGQPYLVMELVEGDPLTKYADTAALDLRGRLDLLARICDAVDYAHQKGVVHRDLKPDNILIDQEGRPKVLDFGIARATDESTLVATQMTQDGQLLGTLTYMAPEQLSGRTDGITPRTDVYALGVVAFELLAGRLPHDVSGLALTTAVRLLSEEDVPPLGTRVPDSGGDVETIVATAVDKDPERRYASAAAMATDIRSYLEDRPITARPASRLYLMRKFTRRNRALVIGAAATFVTLLAGLLVAIVLGARERDQRMASERLAYSTSVVAAARSVAGHQPADARSQLDAAPEHLRGWEWREVTHRLDGLEGAVLYAGATPVTFFRLSPDGAWFVTGDEEGMIRVHDTESGAVELMIDATDGPPENIFLRHGGSEIVELAQRRLRVWDRATGRRLRDHDLEPLGLPDLRFKAMRPVAVYPDERRVVLPLFGRALQVLDIDTGAVVATGPTYPDTRWVHSLTFSPDGSTLCLGLRGGYIDLLDAETFEVKAQLDKPAGAADTQNDCSFSPDGKRLAASTSLRSVRMWDVSEEPPVEVAAMATVNGAHDVCFSPDGAIVAFVPINGGRVELRDGRSGALRRVLTGLPNTGTDLTFWPDGTRLACLGNDGVVRHWDLESHDHGVLRHESFVYAVAVTPDGSMVVTGAWDGYRGRPGCLRWWDLATGQPVATRGGASEMVAALTLSPDGRRLAAAIDDPERPPGRRRRIDLIDMSTGRVHATRETPATHPFDFDPSGQRLLVAGSGDARDITRPPTRVLDASTLAKLFELPEVIRGGAIWSPDGRLIASAGVTSSESPQWVIQLREAAPPYALVHSWPGRALTLAFDAEVGRLACAESSGTVVRDVATGRTLAELSGNMCVAFSPDGARIATGGNQGIVWIWNAATFEPASELRGHEAYVYKLAWSADGEYLVSTSGDATARIWDARPYEDQRRDARERARLVVELEPIVCGLFDELVEPDSVVAHVEADAALTGRARQVALQLVLRESVARE